MVCQRSNKVGSTTELEKLAPLNRDNKRIMKEDMIRHYLSSFANLFQIKPYLLGIILICIDFVKPCMINWGSLSQLLTFFNSWNAEKNCDFLVFLIKNYCI